VRSIRVAHTCWRGATPEPGRASRIRAKHRMTFRLGATAATPDSEPFSSCDLAGRKDVGGLGELVGLSGVAVEFVRDVPGPGLGRSPCLLEPGVSAGSGDRELNNGAPRRGRIAPPHAYGPGKSPEAAVAGLPPRGAQPRPVPFAALGVLLVSFPGWPGQVPRADGVQGAAGEQVVAWLPGVGGDAGGERWRRWPGGVRGELLAGAPGPSQ